MHVETGRDSRGGFLAARKQVAGILRHPAVIHQAHRVQHRAAIFVQQYVLANRIANDFQPRPLGFQSSCIRSKIMALDGRIVHEVELDVLHSPLVD